MYSKKLNITENEMKQIRNLYGIEKSDYVFDFVLTENNKYLIIMDQVFVEGCDGKSIGSIWDNTHIFNEIIKENLNKDGLLIESVEGFVWKKEIVRSILNSKEEINEGLWDDIKAKSGQALKSLGNAALDWSAYLFKKGVIPFLQWVRRGLYTGVGIVVDVVVSILAVKTNAIVWLVVALLDVYEIITGEFDPKDPGRKDMPYFFLICDLMGALFTGAVALPFKKMSASVARNGVKGLSKNMVKYLGELYKKIPTLTSSLKKTGNLLVTKMGPESKGVMSVIMGGVDKILTGLQSFLQKLLSKEGAKAVAMGAGVLGVSKGIEAGVNKLTGGNERQAGDAMGKLIKYNPNAGYSDEDFALN